MPLKRRESIYRIHQTIKDFFPVSKALPDRTTSKRRASTSAPSSPISVRPERKRRVLALLSTSLTPTKSDTPAFTATEPLLPPPKPTKPPSLVLEEAEVLPPTPSSLQQTFGDTDLPDEEDLGGASDRCPSVCLTCTSTDSLAPHRSGAWAPRARARDVAAVQRVLKEIREVKNRTYSVKKGGQGGKYLIERVLHYSGYQLLRDVELKKEENKDLLAYFNGDEFRFDYLRRPSKGDKQFVIHMPSAFHEGMAGTFSDVIVKWLGHLETGTLCTVESIKEETKKVASKIRSSLAKRVKYNEPRDNQMEPDLSFTYRGCTVAGLVVEVAWSQSNLKLPERAKRYIEGKNGEIRTVVGLNMNDIYQGGCRATFSVWKAQLVGDKWSRTTAVDNQEFIDEKGQAVKDCVLSLSLRDFICHDVECNLEDFEDVPLRIPSTKLYELYKSAFDTHVMDEVEEEMGKVMKKADDLCKKILEAEKIIQEQRIEDPGKQTVMGKEELAKLKNIITEAGYHIDKMKSTMENVQEKMDKVDDEMGIIEKKKAEVEKRIANVETKIAKIGADAEKIVEAEETFESVQAISGESIAEGARGDKEDGPGASQAQPTSPRISDQRSVRARLRSAWRVVSKH